MRVVLPGEEAAGPAGNLERAVLRNVNRALLPLFFLVSLCCQLDRSNLAFASLQMNPDLGFSKTVQGLGSGLFFVGYLAQLPANVACVALGARRWLALILVAWGCVATCFAAIRTVPQFLVLRLLLGLAESGAYPGMYYHLSLFYRETHLGVAYTWVTTATAVAGLLGAPVAASLMSLDGRLGLRGWQWLFLIEGLPPLLLALALLLLLPSSPLTASCLTPEERDWLWAWVHGEQALELVALPAGAGHEAGREGRPGGSSSGLEGGEQGEDDKAGLLPVPAAAAERLSTDGQTSEPALPLAHLTSHGRVAVPGAASGRSGHSSEEDEAGEAAVQGAAPPAGPAAGQAEGSGLSRGLLRQGLLDWRVWWLGGVMFAVDIAMNACHFWIPAIIKDLLNLQAPHSGSAGPAASEAEQLRQVVVASLLAALPFALAGGAMVCNAYSSKRHGERRLHVAAPLAVAGCAFGLMPALASWLGLWPALAALAAAVGGIWATHGPLFSWPAALMEQRAGALAFALMKTCGALGGFLGPFLVGLLSEGGSDASAMLMLAAVCGVTAAVVAASAPRARMRDKPSMLALLWGWLSRQLGGGGYSQLG